MKTLICAHRGASGYAPENTLEAFQLAVELKAEAVELDVHLTRDKELIVAHDERIDRVSNGSGLISQLSLRDIKKHIFNATQPAYQEAKAPTLEEVFDLLMETDLLINVELKKEFDLSELKQILSQAQGVELVDDPANNRYPMPIDAEDKDQVFVGRIRRDDSVDNGVNLWVVADNIRKGAATNTVQIAQRLIDYWENGELKGKETTV